MDPVTVREDGVTQGLSIEGIHGDFREESRDQGGEIGGRLLLMLTTVTFDGDTAMMTVAIKPDKTADFEQIIAKVREALLKSDKPERKQQAAGWKLVKGPAMKDGNIIYIHMISPVVKGADYTILPILYEATTDPAEQRKLFEQYRDAFAGGLGNGTYNTVVDLSKP